jgi:putative tryptophan/tyrosine transport system substrate-binding protein
MSMAPKPTAQPVRLLSLSGKLRRAWLKSLAAGVALPWAAPAWSADAQMLMVLSERTAAYLDAAEALQAELVRAGMPRSEMAQLTIDELAALPASLIPAPKVYVAIGTQALAQLTARDIKVPVVATLLPRLSYEQLAQNPQRKSSGPIAGVVLNQSFGRVLDLIRLALPSARKVGVLWGPDSRNLAPAFYAAAQQRGLQWAEATVEAGASAYPALQSLLEDADVLLGVADTQVYNSSTIQNILLTSFRAKVPLVGFSAAYVQAGAALGVFSTPAMLGRQAALLVRIAVQGRPFASGVQFPQEFMVSVNTNVARALGLQLNDAQLTERLRQLEKTP